jgi:UDP-N-acetylglucosamine diphosphorylase / glucose-1-phosphate thymidylyltransferase / UDP-N-acetylgalactosamine diphosphorylase / glucosamine-1-phosphate N-acetyltransferase / galactosamine-1-phosphate N-acetyltransferase
MRIVLFEDSRTDQFAPIAWLRPVFELLCGQFSARERALRALPVTEWGVICRPHLAELYREFHPEVHVNDWNWIASGPTLFLNGRWLCDPAILAHCDRDAAGCVSEHVAWITVLPDEAGSLSSASRWEDALWSLAKTRRRKAINGLLVEYPWDLVSRNSEQLAVDFEHRQPLGRRKVTLPTDFALMGPTDRLFIDPTAVLDPFVVCDTRGGPVYIDAGAIIQAFTRIEGPCYIGRQTQLFRTNLRSGSSLGPVCRIGGEIEASILQGYVNKYHDGFLGHAFISPWCNLGALTTNSDLKNDYSAVRVPLVGDAIATGQTKVGCFVGDHSKLAIGSCLNTGSSIGVMCQVLPAGELLPKHIPSFSRVWHGELTESVSWEQNLDTARTAMNRRNCELTLAQERALEDVHRITQPERDRAFVLQTQRRERRKAG